VRILAEHLSKRYHKHWLFRELDLQFEKGDRKVLLGPNGSGKSTLLKILSGSVAPTEGQVRYMNGDESTDIGHWHRHFTFCAPYTELIKEYSLSEHIDFHFKLKQRCDEEIFDQMLERSGLAPSLDKQVKNFSSGMKQRLKLLLSLCSRADVHFLDEPCTNLDEQGYEFYKALVSEIDQDAIVIVASNDPREYDFCRDQLVISQL